MSLTATASSSPGTLRQEVLVDGRFLLATDEPCSLGGTDSAPSPHELLPAAVAACISTTLRVYSEAKHWELGRVSVEVDYDQAATPRRCDVLISVEHDLSPSQVLRLEKVAASCPVRRALEGGVEFHERIAHGAGLSEAA